MRTTHLLPFVGLIICSGCDRNSSAPQRVQRPVGLERLRAAEAMTLNNVSFLLRTGSTEAEVLKEITERGLVDPIPDVQARSLANYNASARLIQEVQDPKYVLSPEEKTEYLQRSASRNAAAQGQASHAAQLQKAEEMERRRLQSLQQQTMAAVDRKEQAIRAREQAKSAYEAERSRLESEKQQLQARLNNYRKYGYSDSSIARLEQELKENEQARNRLKAP